ncbi:MAG: RnfABCDGE type electron transport complex subunit D [Dehalococcoidia bacterium]
MDRLKRLARSPKGLLIGIFALVIGVALIDQDVPPTLTHLGVAVAAAVITELIAMRAQGKRLSIPDGAILSGLIVGMVLSPFEHWYVTGAAGVLAITSKHLFRVGPANIFNPAALAIVAVSVLFDGIQDWWGALPAQEWTGAMAIAAAGVFIADRVNKLPLVLTLLGVYFALFTGASFLGSHRDVAEIFRSPDFQMVLFFALFMADDPPTVPVKYRDQLIFGGIVAVSCFAFFEAFGWVYFLPAGLLVGNVYEGGRKWHAARKRRQRVDRRMGVGTPAAGPVAAPRPEPTTAHKSLWSRPE